METSSEWVEYRNGNYLVSLNLKDGTKIRRTEDDVFIASRPESMDVKITNRCSHGCPFCHEDSRPDGKRADLRFAKLLVSTMAPYTEVAVGGGNLMDDPQHTETFLKMLKERKCVSSITLRQEDFLDNLELLARWREERLVYGIGVSLSDSSAPALIPALKQFPTAVLHTIVGIIGERDWEILRNQGLKVLLLGYKDKRRGHEYLSDEGTSIAANTQWLTANLKMFMSGFAICSFDNLALEQLPVKEVVGEKIWERFYMGDDGTATFYIDLVERRFAVSSTAEKTDDIMVFTEDGECAGFWPVDRMFERVRECASQPA